MAKVYVITHGERVVGPDPIHTKEGLAKVKSLPLPQNISHIRIGIGKRFVEIYSAFKDKLIGVPVKFSPFCGTALSLGSEQDVILPDGTVVDRKDYIALYKEPAFHVWEFIKSLPSDTLLCAGGELVTCFGIKSEKGSLYEIDPDGKTCVKVA